MSRFRIPRRTNRGARFRIQVVEYLVPVNLGAARRVSFLLPPADAVESAKLRGLLHWVGFRFFSTLGCQDASALKQNVGIRRSIMSILDTGTKS